LGTPGGGEVVDDNHFVTVVKGTVSEMPRFPSDDDTLPPRVLFSSGGFVPKPSIVEPAVSSLSPVTVGEPPTHYPKVSILVEGESETPCVISASFSSAHLRFSIDSSGSGFRREPLVYATAVVLSPQQVNSVDKWSKVTATAGNSAGILEDGTLMRWPVDGFFEPQRVGFGVRLTLGEGERYGRLPDYQYSTPENIDALLPQTAGPILFSYSSLYTTYSNTWLGVRYNSTTSGPPVISDDHFGGPRIIYYAGIVPADYLYLPDVPPADPADRVAPEWVYRRQGIPTSGAIGLVPGFFVGGVVDHRYWHSPNSPAYSPESVFRYERVREDFRSGSFLTQPSLSGGLSATLVSPGKCRDIVFANGALFAISDSGQVWMIARTPVRSAPYFGDPASARKRTIKFYSRSFAVRWEWPIVEYTDSVDVFKVYFGQGSFEQTIDLKRKRLGAVSKEVVSDEGGYGDDVEVFEPTGYRILVEGGGSGYRSEDTFTLRLRGGKKVESRRWHDPGTVEVSVEDIEEEVLQGDGGRVISYGNMGLPTGENPRAYVQSFEAVSKGTRDGQILKGMVWSGVVEKSYPVFSEIEREYRVFLEIVDGKIVAVNLPAGAESISDYIVTLPSVDLVSNSGSGSGAILTLVPGSAIFSSPRPVDSYTSIASDNYRGPGVLVRADGLLTRAPTAEAPYPPPATLSYGDDFSHAVGKYVLKNDRRLFRVRDGRPVPTPNLSVSIDSPGGGYTTLPRIEVEQPGGGFFPADAPDGKVVSLGVDDGGFGYTESPILDVEGGATAACVVSGPVSSVQVTSGGSGYSHPPRVRFTGAGWPAKATCAINESGSVVSVSVENGGTYRAAPGVEFDPVPEVTSVSLTSGGGGYTSNPRVEIVGNCGGSGAIATAKINGQVTSVEVSSGGSGYRSDDPPQVVFTGGGGSGAAAAAVIDDQTGQVTAVTVTEGGSWYGSRPSVRLVGGSGVGASARASFSGPVGSLTLTAGGKGFLEPPAVLFIGGGGTGASASSSVGTRGAGAAANATINGSILYAYVVSPGGGYRYSPNVRIEPGSNREIARLSSAFAAGEITVEEYESGAKAAIGKIQARAEIPTSPTSDTVVAVRVESVRGARRTSNGLRNRDTFTTTLSVSGTRSYVELTNVSGKIVENSRLREVRGEYRGSVFRLSDLRFSDSAKPRFSLYDNTGVGAEIVTTLGSDGRVSGASFSNEGTGYTGRNKIQITGGRFRLVQCEAACSVSSDGSIASISVTSPGDGYLLPAVIVHGGRGSGCLATARLRSGFLPRGVQSIVVNESGSGYSSDDPPSVYVAELSPPFFETEFCESLNSGIETGSGTYRLTQWTSEQAEYASNASLPYFAAGTTTNYADLISTISGSGAGVVIDQFATFECVESLLTRWGEQVAEPYDGGPVAIRVVGNSESPLVLSAVGVTWSQVFSNHDTGAAAGIREA
jgi:hypothetical protein